MQIGIAGLGRMGAAVAARLMEVGHTVTVWNRTPDKAKPLTDAGAKQVETPEDLAEHSEVIITMVTDADAIDHVYNGEHGLLAGDVHDRLFIEMSTVRPEVQSALAKVAINMPLMIYYQALGEALAMARPMGLPPERLMDIIADTSGAPTMMKARAPTV